MAAKSKGVLATAVAGARERIVLLNTAVAALWFVEMSDWIFFQGALDQYGVEPRTVHGLVGVLFAPFLHGGAAHLVGNTLSFWMLGFLATSRAIGDFWSVCITSALTGGLGAWAFGKPDSIHIGVSGVCFGFLGFLMGRGFFERKIGAMLLSAAVIFFFGGMMGGVLPTAALQGISWETHLFGWVGGLLVAWLNGVQGAARRR